MFCPTCGNQLPEEAVFCNRCGMRMSAVPGNAASGEHSQVVFLEPTVAANVPPPSITQPIQLPVAAPAQPPVLSAVQQRLIQIFKPELAKNALFGSILGSLSAFLPGLLLSLLLLSVAHALTPAASHPEYALSGEDGADAALGIVPLHAIFQDGMQLFLVMHGVGQHIQYVDSASGNNSFGSSFSSPLNGLLLLPALLLILGGYLAASTDLWDRPRSSLLRGMAIAIPYTCLLLIMLPSVNGSVLTVPAGNATETLDLNGLSLLVFGLLWAAIFGLLGASLKLAHGRWRQYIRHYLRITPYAQLIGPAAGSLVTAGLGLALSFLLLCSGVTYTQLSVPALQSNLCLSGGWQSLTLWSIAQGPLHAVNLFFFSLGAQITIHTPSQPVPCFYSALPHILTIRGGLPLSPWFYLILLIPAYSLFIGGRTSAALAGARGLGPGAVAGAAMALPFTALMMLLTPFSSVTQTYTASTSASSSMTLSAGVGAFDVLLWSLLFSVVMGALGGLYQASAMEVSISRFMADLANLLKALVKPLYSLSGHSFRQATPGQATSATPARSLFYGALLCAFLLLLVSLLAGGGLIAFNQTVAIGTNQRIRDICAVLLVALPGLFLVAACFSALCYDPGRTEGKMIPVRQTVPLLANE